MEPWVRIVYLLVVALWYGEIFGLPMFSRKYEITCSSCHSVVPELNDFGKRFHERGFILEGALERTARTLELEDDLIFDATVPISIRVKLTPILWEKDLSNQDTTSHIRYIIPETAEVIWASRFSPYVSGKVEYIYYDDGKSELSETYLDIHFAGGEVPLNMRIGYHSPMDFMLEPTRRITRENYEIYELTFANGAKPSSNGAGFSLYGNPSEEFFYTVGIFVEDRDFDLQDYYGRLKFTPLSGLDIAGLIYTGKGEVLDTNGSISDTNDYIFYGPEVDFFSEPLHFFGCLLFGQDKPGDSTYKFVGGFVDLGYQFNPRVLTGIRYNFQTEENIEFEKISSIIAYTDILIVRNVITSFGYWQNLENTDLSRINWRIELSY